MSSSRFNGPGGRISCGLIVVTLLTLASACTPSPRFSLSGRVTGTWQCVDMASTIHPPTITLVPLDRTQPFSRSAPDFLFSDVPEGSYTLRVTCTANGQTYPPMPVAIAGKDEAVEVVLPFPHLERRDPLLTWPGHTDRIGALAFTADGLALVSAAADGTARRWAVDDGRLLGEWRHGQTDPLVPLRLTPDGAQLAAVTGRGQVTVWDSLSARPLHTWQANNLVVERLAWSPDGTLLIGWSEFGDGPAAVWHVANGDAWGPLEGPIERQGQRVDLLFLFDSLRGTPIAVAAERRTLFVTWFSVAGPGEWEVETHRMLEDIYPGWISDGDVAAGGQRLALGLTEIENRGRLLLWDLETNQVQAAVIGHQLAAVAFSPDGRLVATAAGDNSVIIWDGRTAEPLLVLAGDRHGLERVAWSPDGRLVAAAGRDGDLNIWAVGY